MRTLLVWLSSAWLIAAPSSAQSKLDVADLAHHAFTVGFEPGGTLNLHIRSGDVHIVGGSEDRIAVRIGGASGGSSTDIAARFRRSGSSADLDISGGPHNDVAITVEVPRRCNLWVRVPAGDLDVEGVTGDKDVRLRAGNLKIGIGSPAEYARVEASVTSGDIEARPFGESHGGLFRSFTRTGPGRYTLVASLWAGDLTLK